MSAPEIHAGSSAERIHGLMTLLNVSPRAEHIFEGTRKKGGKGRIYGGEVVAQALAAASKTVPAGRQVHSLHAYFLRGGNEDYPASYRVEADFDGRSFSNRRVIASQQGEVILNLAASFHIEEPGHHHQSAMPEVPPPENLRDMLEAAQDEVSQQVKRQHKFNFLYRPWPMELRSVGPVPLAHSQAEKPETAYWFRAAAPIPDAPQWMHRVMLAFISDLGVLSAASLPHGPFEMQGASIDHSLWFHRNVQIDDWLLYHMESPWSGGARGLGFGRIFDRAGHLVASVAQEGLMRDRAFRDI